VFASGFGFRIASGRSPFLTQSIEILHTSKHPEPQTIYTIFQQVANMDDAWKVNSGAMSAEARDRQQDERG
jgi:hypothetical protein